MKRDIRILFLIDGLNGGGKERQLVEIIRYLKGDDRYTMGVITFNKNKHYSVTVRENVPFYFELNKRPTGLEPLFTLWKYFWRFNPDIVHSWDTLTSLYACFLTSFSRAKFINGSIRDAGIEKKWQKALKGFLIKRADVVIANSEAGLTHYKVQGEVIFNAINMSRFGLIPVGEGFNMIMVANFSDYKDHKTFIDAAGELLNRNRIDLVYMAGDGPRRKEFMNYIKKTFAYVSERFIFLGAINNVEEYLSRCMVGVLCSTQEYGEGISNSVLEYMAAGLVAITTDTGGMHEVIDDGENGYLVKEKDARSIVDIVIQLRENPELMSRLRANARKTIGSKFSYEKNIESLKKIYSGLCTENLNLI